MRFDLGHPYIERRRSDDNDDGDTENREIACERILSWRTEGTYKVFRRMYGKILARELLPNRECKG